MHNLKPYSGDAFSLYKEAVERKADGDSKNRLVAAEAAIESYYNEFDTHFLDNTLSAIIPNRVKGPQYKDLYDMYSFDAGFRIVIMLPPYRRTHRAVNIRPASNFYLSYTVMYQQFNNLMYCTDPEENMRDGWFSRDLLQVGSHTMDPDFIITEKKKK